MLAVQSSILFSVPVCHRNVFSMSKHSLLTIEALNKHGFLPKKLLLFLENHGDVVVLVSHRFVSHCE